MNKNVTNFTELESQVSQQVNYDKDPSPLERHKR